MPTLTFERSAAQFEFEEAVDLIELDDYIMFGCRSGNCGTCMIQIINGAENLSIKTERETRLFELTGETDPAIRLACQCRAFGDVVMREVN
uniref:2Fe-2S iron-sulfur cluster-binding protein n=1 Tax=Trinickia acidisoli TaxID=2767482 RepID=UPI001A8F1021